MDESPESPESRPPSTVDALTPTVRVGRAFREKEPWPIRVSENQVSVVAWILTFVSVCATCGPGLSLSRERAQWAPDLAAGAAILSVLAALAIKRWRLFFEGLFGHLPVYVWLSLFAAVVTAPTSSCGRPFRLARRVRLASPRGGSASLPQAPSVEQEVDPRHARMWRDMGLAEHASIATFAQLVQDLMALGAPLHLLSATQAALADEIRHARVCFDVATRLGETCARPHRFAALRAGRLPSTESILFAKVAREALIDGVLGEGTASAVLLACSRSTPPNELTGIYNQLGKDEGRHAEVAWSILTFCLEHGPSDMPARLEAWLSQATQPPSPLALGKWDNDTERRRLGLVSRHEEAALFQTVRYQSQQRLQDATRIGRDALST